MSAHTLETLMGSGVLIAAGVILAAGLAIALFGGRR